MNMLQGGSNNLPSMEEWLTNLLGGGSSKAQPKKLKKENTKNLVNVGDFCYFCKYNYQLFNYHSVRYGGSVTRNVNFIFIRLRLNLIQRGDQAFCIHFRSLVLYSPLKLELAKHVIVGVATLPCKDECISDFMSIDGHVVR